MKITIGKHSILLPTVLIVNRLTAGWICKTLKKEGVELTKKQLLWLAKEAKRYKKRHGAWNLVEIYEKNGDFVIIKI